MAIQYRRATLSALAFLLSDTLVATLHGTGYTPAGDTDQWVSNLTSELPAGNGYATGGQTLTQKTLAYHPAASWGVSWAASTAFYAGQLMVQGGYIYRALNAGTSGASAPTWPTVIGSTVADNGVTWMCMGTGSMVWAASTAYTVGWVIRVGSYLYRAVAAGTTGASAPTWPSVVGASVTDGSVTWENIGAGLIAFACANPSWPNATFNPGPRYAVFSDRTPATTATQPLEAYIDYGAAQNGGGGAFTVQINPQGLLLYYAP